MDGIRATPYQYPLVGSVNELIGGLLGYMRDPRRTQQMQGLAGLLESTGIPKTVERLAYGEPLTNIQRANVPLLRPETAEALMTLAPVPPATGRAAMAVGRAGERMAERVVPQIMERGGMPAGLLESMSSRTVSPLTVYHGSPAKFERFDPTKIGSGEGAQAYGYGHYVAQSPAVAKEYQTALSNKAGEVLIDGKKLNPKNYEVTQIIARYSDDKKALQSNLSKYIKGSKDNPYADIESAQLALDALKTGKNVSPASSGSFYEIDLPDEQIAKMLDWDKPLSEQPQKIQQAIYNDLTDAGYSKTIVNDLLNRKTGMELYKTLYKGMEQGDEAAINLAKKLNLGEQGMMMEAPALASESLRRMGIPGIRYLDQGSRGTGEGTSNFVVFPGNEDLLRILKRNEDPLGLLSP